MRDSLPRAVTLTDRQPARPRAAQPGRQQVRRANTRMYASASAVCMVVAACGVLRTLVVELGVSLRVDVGGSLRSQVASERRALCVTRCARVRLTRVSGHASKFCLLEFCATHMARRRGNRQTKWP